MSRWEGGSVNDDFSEFVRVCDTYADMGSYWPRDFGLIAMSERFHVPPWELEKAPAFWVNRMGFYLRAEAQAARDRKANEEAPNLA